MWGVSSETEALVCFYFPGKAKPQLLISFLEEVNTQHICKLGHRIGYKKIRRWGVSVSTEGKVLDGVILRLPGILSELLLGGALLQNTALLQQNIISSCSSEESFP